MKNSSLYKKMNIKNKIKDIAFICIIGYSVTACTNHKTATIEADKVMDINTIDGYMDEVVDTVIYLPLEMTDNSALSRVQKIWADDSLYFLADFNYSKIVAYTHEGQLKFVLNKRGQGPEEYLEIRNFTVDGGKLYTIDNFQNKIFIFDKNNGDFIDSKQTNIIASDLVALDNGQFLLTAIPNGKGWKTEQAKNLVFLTDENFNVKNTFYPYQQDYCEPLSRYAYFSATDSSAIFSSFLFDGYTEFKKADGTILQKVEMELEHHIPEEQKGELESYDGSSNYEFVSQCPIACKQYLFVSVTKDKKMESYIYDARKEKLYGIDEASHKKVAFIIGSDKEHFISYIPDKAYYDELVKYGLQKADSLTETHLEQDGSALVLYKMK